MSEIIKARQLLAKECEKQLMPGAAEEVLSGKVDGIPAMKAILAALQPQWQDISTAPRDGTEILGFSPGVGVPLLIRWISPQDYMTDGECESYIRGASGPELSVLNDWLEQPSWCYADFLQGDILDSMCQPTKWMPLPAAPEVWE